jgi:hypothetical protein
LHAVVVVAVAEADGEAEAGELAWVVAVAVPAWEGEDSPHRCPAPAQECPGLAVVCPVPRPLRHARIREFVPAVEFQGALALVASIRDQVQGLVLVLPGTSEEVHDPALALGRALASQAWRGGALRPDNSMIS